MKSALIIEDDRDQAQLAARLLRSKDFQPTIATTGAEAYAVARQKPPSLILLDVLLPGADGYEVCRTFRGDPRTRTVPIVMVTALGDDTSRRLGLRVGANAYVSKPYEAAVLFEAVDSALAWKRSLDRQHVRGEVQLELSSETPALMEANDFVLDLCRETPLLPEQISHIEQALLEMGQNAIEWGNCQRRENLVRVTYRVRSDRIEITVRDEGEGFDLHNLPHAASPDDPLSHMEVRERKGLREGGFGLMIARGLLDELRHNERGNEVTLVKWFPDRAGPSHN